MLSDLDFSNLVGGEVMKLKRDTVPKDRNRQIKLLHYPTLDSFPTPPSRDPILAWDSLVYVWHKFAQPTQLAYRAAALSQETCRFFDADAKLSPMGSQDIPRGASLFARPSV